MSLIAQLAPLSGHLFLSLHPQLIIFMALGRGLSQMCCAPLTLHTKTAIYVAELMAGVRVLGSRVQSGLSQTNKHSLCGVKLNQVALHTLTLWPDVTVGCVRVTIGCALC